MFKEYVRIYGILACMPLLIWGQSNDLYQIDKAITDFKAIFSQAQLEFREDNMSPNMHLANSQEPYQVLQHIEDLEKQRTVLLQDMY